MQSFQDIEHFIKTLSAAIKKKIPTKVSQLANDAGYKTTDTNTTYKLSKSGSTVTLTGSDGSTTSVTDSNTTYSSLKNPYSLDIQNNGTTVASYDGSAAKTVNLTNATASSAGLMSAADKKAVDREFFRMLPKGGTRIPANADLNSIEYIKVGNYYNTFDRESTTIKNIPVIQSPYKAFMMYVLSPLSEAYDDESTRTWVYRLRIFVTYTGLIYTQQVNSYTTIGKFSYGPWVKMTNSDDLGAVSKIINDHIANKSNPHAVTKAQVGLGNVANLDQSKAIKSITRSGTTFTAIALDGTTTTFTQQDTNTTYPVFAGATASENGTTGLVPEPTIEDAGKYLCGDGTWKTVSGGSGTSDIPVEVPITKTTNVIRGTIVVYRIGHLLQIYANGLLIKRSTDYASVTVCSISNVDVDADGFTLGSNIAIWTAFDLADNPPIVSGSGLVLAQPNHIDPNSFDVMLIGVSGSSQYGVYFSLTVPLLDKKEE